VCGPARILSHFASNEAEKAHLLKLSNPENRVGGTPVGALLAARTPSPSPLLPPGCTLGEHHSHSPCGGWAGVGFVGVRAGAQDLYNAEVLSPHHNIVSLLEAFPSVDLPLAVLLDVLEKVQPAYYSISSSPKVCVLACPPPLTQAHPLLPRRHLSSWPLPLPRLCLCLSLRVGDPQTAWGAMWGGMPEAPRALERREITGHRSCRGQRGGHLWPSRHPCTCLAHALHMPCTPLSCTPACHRCTRTPSTSQFAFT
jgi:hypothetical protein